MTRGTTFWDMRRAAVRAEEEAEAAAAQAALEAEQQRALAEKSDEDILTELGLPDPDTLAKGDDFSAFMAKAVPEHIRKRALRNLWRSNPVLACLDGLNDYDDDYLTGSFGNAPIQTSYQVGKGLLAHVLEMERQDEVIAKDPAPLDKEENLAEDHGESFPAETEQVAEPDTAGEQVPAQQEPEPGRPRRMVFHFDGNSA
ncbi:DUF3306 domain-containing protein [Roseovarius sp. ZX-A-9]|uniref:DUF3306 domain-containing protein n=1 Tax=Roseovarius sp. ZX-A-9 TaxID=3014783 RepID=UPI00232E423F|nr:DUF3306 domain-containing protein [Roseovarius sp. ZX-A-9]